MTPASEAAAKHHHARKFPYNVYFRIRSDSEVRVLSVYHVNLDPGKWLEHG
jgi:hypothetical protein